MPACPTLPTRRRVLAAALALTVGAGALSACGSSSSGGSKTLKILIHSNGPTDAAFKALSQKFEQANPGVKVQLETVPTANFPNVQTARLRAGSVDITEGLSAGGAQPNPDYVKGVPQRKFIQAVNAGNWVDLSGQAFMKNFSKGVTDALTYNGKIYSVPTGLTFVTGVYYNKSLFAKYGLQVPTTWNELVAVCQKLKDNGVTPLTMGGKDTWPAGLPMLGLVQTLFPDLKGLDEGLWKGTVDLSDDATKAMMSRLQTLYGFTEKNFPGIDYTTITSRFASGKAAMLPDGTWEAPAIDTAKPGFEYGYFPLPGSDDATRNAVLGGKLEFSFSVPSSAKNKSLAEKWLAFYSQPENYQTVVKASGFLPAQPNIQTTPFLDSIQKYLGPTGFAQAWDQVFHPNPQAGPMAKFPFAYNFISPMGNQSNMDKLTKGMQSDWSKALVK